MTARCTSPASRLAALAALVLPLITADCAPGGDARRGDGVRPADSAVGTTVATGGAAGGVAGGVASGEVGGDSAASQPPAGPAAKSPAKPATPPAGKASATAAAKPRYGPTGGGPDTVPGLWPVQGPAPLPGAILPGKRIVAFYGNPLSKRMGILGELPPDQMLAKLDREVAAWRAADPSTPVVPALHLIASVAQGTPGKDSLYRYRAHPDLIEKVYGWAKQKGAILFLDVQIGKSTVPAEVERLLPWLQRPDVHLALDPEFAMTKGGLPGRRIGTLDASHVNWASSVLAGLVDRYKLPPKVLIVHRFTGPMLTNYKQIKLDPRVQIVIDMDGWGPPHGKRATWSRFIYPQPVQYTGFKLFYHNDTKDGFPMMKPKDVLALTPDPVYIQYQ